MTYEASGENPDTMKKFRMWLTVIPIAGGGGDAVRLKVEVKNRLAYVLSRRKNSIKRFLMDRNVGLCIPGSNESTLLVFVSCWIKLAFSCLVKVELER